VPTKQGGQYQLNLVTNQGPYLSKDIMHNNSKSISLLAGTNIIKSFAALNSTLKLCDSKQQQDNKELMNIESFSSIVRNLEDMVNSSISLDSKLKI